MAQLLLATTERLVQARASTVAGQHIPANYTHGACLSFYVFFFHISNEFRTALSFLPSSDSPLLYIVFIYYCTLSVCRHLSLSPVLLIPFDYYSLIPTILLSVVLVFIRIASFQSVNFTFLLNTKTQIFNINYGQDENINCKYT